MQNLIVSRCAPAVQYLRMSKEHQRYSIENQSMQIAEYAAANGYDIVDTYADLGRSGLTLRERHELNRLLHDVTDPNRRFSTILVLDVSRWGRFQDVDQHAAYEFLCRDMGVRIEYVAEAFSNDGSFTASLLKHMKRIMAGEFSRELSAKISYGKIRGAKRGHRQGGPANFGLKRVLVDSQGNPKQLLAPGEHKSSSEDRVVIAPGSEDEQEVVRLIYDLHLSGTSSTAIARHLNYKNVPTPDGLRWSFAKVRIVLTNELYTGIYVYNRTSQKLKTSRVPNPQGLWIRVPVCDGIISPDAFRKAQSILAEPQRGKGNRYSSSKMVDGLKRLLAEQGRLTAAIINYCPYVPEARTYYRRFGSLPKLYAKIGYHVFGKHDRAGPRPRRNKPYTKEELLAQLRRALTEHTYLSKSVIDSCAYTPSTAAYSKVFGSLTNAYAAIGYHAYLRPNDIYNKEFALRKLKTLFEAHGYICTALLSQDSEVPSCQWFRLHFGSFKQACTEAGIDYGGRRMDKAFRPIPDCRDIPEGGGAPVRNVMADLPNEELLNHVRRLYNEKGRISSRLLFLDPSIPSLYSVRKRYASLSHLYAASGLPADVVARSARRKPSIGK